MDTHKNKEHATKPVPEIQVWERFDAIPINDDSLSSGLKIRIDNDAIQLPVELEDRVEGNWKEVSNITPVKNNPILFLKNLINAPEGNNIIETNVRGFKYTQTFNRNPSFQDMVDDVNKYKLLSISTHVHLLTKDNKLLFGTKKNQLNQISGFSGFPNAVEDGVISEGNTYLDISNTIKRRLTSEMGYLTRAIKDMYGVGVIYCNTPGLRGLDTDYLIRLDETAENAKARFIESFQFDKNLYAVDFHPEKIIEFVKKIHEDGKQMSKYALGCEYLIMRSFFGEKEAAKLSDSIRDIGITFSDKNEMGYLKK